jgi:hypothetical protein
MEPELPIGGPQWPETAEGKAVEIVSAWQRAHARMYASPIALRDLALRIARALEKEIKKNDR